MPAIALADVLVEDAAVAASSTIGARLGDVSLAALIQVAAQQRILTVITHTQVAILTAAHEEDADHGYY